ncbi:hypothetical protein GCM10011511_53270 [Puia dinghuensis]|uniref:Uncharacterized protein n=1 Tax=Puia dinghuensis TaxID=1792502 RepID=A0A8J2UIN6_9BACT|nr:hypothetical protein GCM10011511_53270 [Puia dinghuensis]
MGMILANLGECLDAIHYRHLNIKQDDVRFDVLEQVEQLHSIVSFRYQLYIFLYGKSRLDPGPEKGMIIGYGNFDCLVKLGSFHTI